MESQRPWALAACERIMRPLVKLALAMGLKHPQLEALLRDLLLDEARRSWLASGVEPNISQLSVTTGLNRKAVTAKIREPDDALPHTELSAAAKTLTLWLQLLETDPKCQSLPVVADAGRRSFEAIARQASRGNVHHRTILDELLRLHMAIEHDGHVELNTDSFVPATDLRAMLAFLADNARDHLLAGVSNTLAEAPPMLEQAIYAQGLSMRDCERIQGLVRQRWTELHREMANEMTQAVDRAGGEGSARVRVGIYTYFEDGADLPLKTPEGKK